MVPVSERLQTIDFCSFLVKAAVVARAQQQGTGWLVADIGATSSRCAVVNAPHFELDEWEAFRNDDFTSLQDLLAHFAATCRAQPDHCALAVAAPIVGDDIAMINRDWRFSRSSIAAALDADEILVINDFHAVAYFLTEISAASRLEIGSATEYGNANRAVLGPGSGLGMAAWIGDARTGTAMTGEGGHITIAGRNATEDRISTSLRERFGHCSAERILSGPGLVALHETMHGTTKMTSEEISANIDDENCRATMAQFFSFLGSAAADLALITGAFGGVYIAGGIVPSMIEQFAASDFRQRFEDKNRYRDYMRRIPTYVITDPIPGLRGLAVYLKTRDHRGAE